MKNFKLDVLHIGFPKAGSTYLQQNVFPNLEKKNYTFIHRDFEKIVLEAVSTFGTYLWNESLFISKLDELFSRFNSHLICSSELLTSTHQFSENDFGVLEVILRNFNFKNVLIVLRDPYEYIYSSWSQQVKEGGVYNLRKYLRNNYRPTKRRVNTIIDKLNYPAYINALSSVRFNANLVIIPYDPRKLDELVLDRLNFKIQRNKKKNNKRFQHSLSPAGLYLMLIFNRFCDTKRSAGPIPYWIYMKYRIILSKLFPKKPKLDSEAMITRYLLPDEIKLLNNSKVFLEKHRRKNDK